MTPAPIKILLVEDTASDAALVIRTLRRANPEIVVEYVETEAAMRAALGRGGWDAVLSDWAMPGFGALAALAIVKETGLDLPFIIVSGTIGDELAVEAMRAGVHDYVLKEKLARLAPAIEREIRDAKARGAHRRIEARFRALIEKSAETVLLTAADGTILYASPPATYVFGWFPEELVGRTFASLVVADDRAIADGTLQRLHADHTIGLPAELRIARPDDSTRWIAVSGTNLMADPDVSAIVLNVRDVSERRRAAEALRVSEARFARLAEAGIIGVLTADVHGHILQANDAYLKMIGYSREEVLASTFNWLAIIPPDQQEAVARAGAQLASTGLAPPWETVALRKDGTRVPMLVGMAMLDFPFSIAFAIDLTERKEAEVALRATEEQLRQAQKMEAVGRLAGGIAHDFNNILSVILSYAELMRDDLAEGDSHRGDVTEICNAAWRAAELTRQLLMFSRKQVLAPKVLDLNEVVATMDKMLRRVLGEDVELVTVPARALGRVKVDPTSIEQVIMNLVVNARDAMPTGGKLTLETGNVTLASGPHVMLAVTDTGIGMDAATQARIFEPFFTTKPKDKGTGLGLSTVFGIAQQSGGSVWVYSELGIGSTFKVYLPRLDAPLEATRARGSGAIGGSETVLLVEDEEQVRTVAREILRRNGYTVLEAPDPPAAIALCATHPGEIHLLLTDVVMPKMSGPELTRQLVATRPTLKVLCMSGYTDDSIVRHGVLNSDIAFLQKPFTPEALTRKVREVLDAQMNLR